MKWFIFAMIFGVVAYLCFACTYSVNLVHTEGSAEDVVDDTQDPNFSPTLDLPIKPL